jgi:hypothetical protein
MTADDTPPTLDEYQGGAGWCRFGVLLLAFAAVGLPVNEISVYALLLILSVIVCTGEIRTRPRAWLAAIGIVAIAVAGQIWLAPPRIDEGHNLFLPGGPTQALKRGLPPEVYSQLAADFDKQYPPELHCKAEEAGCWLGAGFPVAFLHFPRTEYSTSRICHERSLESTFPIRSGCTSASSMSFATIGIQLAMSRAPAATGVSGWDCSAGM